MHTEKSPEYWYDHDADTARGRRMLEALRLYHAADSAMRRRTRHEMSMGENELLVLRFILRATGQGRQVTPTEIARYLGISTASTTALIDRLETSVHLRREPHPTDRRSVIVTTTAQTDHEVRATLGDMHARMMAATGGVSDAEADAIVAFLERMQIAVDEVAATEPEQ